MPYTLNGIGTTYYGNKNPHEVKGTCEFCKASAKLKSYDTMLWFVVVFVPLIPLGRKRIIDMCSVCSKHRALPLHEWKELQAKAQEVTDAYNRDPRNPQLAREALQTAMGIRDLPAFLKLSEQIEANLLDNSETISLLASGHAHVGRNDEAERLLRLVVEIDDSVEHREALAANLLLQGKAQEAEPYLSHLQDQVPHQQGYIIFFLAQKYQSMGRHEDARRVFDWAARVHPAIEQDKEFIRMRSRSVAKLGGDIKSKAFSNLQYYWYEQAWLRNLAVCSGIVLAVLLIYSSIAFYMGTSHEVYVVNGLPITYNVTVNGAPLTLAPHSAVATRVPEGQVTIDSTNPALLTPRQQADLQTSFWFRPLSRDVVVFNLDQTAVIMTATVTYTSKNSTNPPPTPPTPELHAGDFLHIYSNIYHPFTPAPSQISMKGNSETRRVLSVLPDQGAVTVMIALDELTTQLGKPAVSQLALRRYRAVPTDTQYLYLFISMSTPQEVVATLEPMIKENGFDINGHRIYQTMMQRLGREAEVVSQYEALAAKSPNDKNSIYLYGRSMTDSDYPKARKLMEQAAEGGDKACAFAVYWLASDALENGAFAESIRLGDLLQKHPVKVDGSRQHLLQALLATRQYDRAIELSRKMQGGSMAEYLNGYFEEIFAHAASGNSKAIGEVISRLTQKLKELNVSDQEISQVTQKIQIEADSIATGQSAALIKHYQASESVDYQFLGALMQGDLATAEKKITEESEDTAHLQLYIAAMLKGQTDLANRQRQAAIAKLEHGDAGDRRFAKALSGTSQDSAEKLLHIRSEVSKKLLLITALGIHRPEMRPACFALAGTLNFNPRFPHKLISDALAYPFPQQTP